MKLRVARKIARRCDWYRRIAAQLYRKNTWNKVCRTIKKHSNKDEKLIWEIFTCYLQEF